MKCEILEFIDALRESDFYIQHLFTAGSCYQFHILLSKLYPGCEPRITSDKNHIVTLYRGKYYDIKGEVDQTYGLTALTSEELEIAKTWSFRKNSLILLDECECCGEPIIYASPK